MWLFTAPHSDGELLIRGGSTRYVTNFSLLQLANTESERDTILSFLNQGTDDEDNKAIALLVTDCERWEVGPNPKRVWCNPAEIDESEFDKTREQALAKYESNLDNEAKRKIQYHKEQIDHHKRKLKELGANTGTITFNTGRRG